ncbi:hypothetical protein [Actinokineospora pegani]|uniref:hypothetical protein n=1 Tax=Actinokineospora pegani TaxID=2654637 RepID=UPI0012EAD731|nr:hypothetical protein [Actinokineospora pegani]
MPLFDLMAGLIDVDPVSRMAAGAHFGRPGLVLDRRAVAIAGTSVAGEVVGQRSSLLFKRSTSPRCRDESHLLAARFAQPGGNAAWPGSALGCLLPPG